jgi:hypothetical protein
MRFSFVTGKVREIAKTPTPLPHNMNDQPARREGAFRIIEARYRCVVAFEGGAQGRRILIAI